MTGWSARWLVWLVAPALGLVLAACGGDDDTIAIDTGGDVVVSGSQAGYEEQAPACFMATDATALERLWVLAGAEAGGLSPQPPEGLTLPVVGVFLGQRPTAGYAVSIAEGRHTDGTIELETVIQEPAPDDVVAQVLTSPFVLLSLGANGIERATDVEVVGDLTLGCTTDLPEQEQGP